MVTHRVVPYLDCSVCKGSGVFDNDACPSCVWRRWYAEGVAAGALATLEEVEADRADAEETKP